MVRVSLPDRILLGAAIFAVSQFCFWATRTPDIYVWIGASTLSTFGIATGPLIGGILLALTDAGGVIATALFSLLLCAIIYACKMGMQARLQDS